MDLPSLCLSEPLIFSTPHTRGFSKQRNRWRECASPEWEEVICFAPGVPRRKRRAVVDRFP